MYSVVKTRVWSHPTGYKYLAIYKNAELLDGLTRKITEKFPKSEHRMKEQMDDAMRSFKVNIVEGWKRPTTREYLTFLGYSQASLAELTDNAEDCLRHKIISQTDYDEYYGWLKKSDFLLNRLIISLEEKMAREQTVPHAEKLRRIYAEERKREEDGRKIFGFDEVKKQIEERQERLNKEYREKVLGVKMEDNKGTEGLIGEVKG